MPSRADVADIEPHILARQMVGQRLAMGRPFGWLLLDSRTVLPFAGQIAFEIFKPNRKLIGIEALGTATELRALGLVDDRLEALDLAVAMHATWVWRHRVAPSRPRRRRRVHW